MTQRTINRKMFYCPCDNLPEFSALSSTLILGIAGSHIQVCLRLLVTSYINIDILELLIIKNLYTCVVSVTAVFNFMVQRKNSEGHLVEYFEILYGHAFTACWFVVRKSNPLLNSGSRLAFGRFNDSELIITTILQPNNYVVWFEIFTRAGDF